jgi:hypothetical protein
MSSTSSRRGLVRMGQGAALVLGVLAAEPGFAQQRSAVTAVPVLAIALKPELSLPLLPPLRLTAPVLLAPLPAAPEGVVAHHHPWLSYWHEAAVPAEWRDASDAELRLWLETGALDLGDLSLTTGIRTTPEREREQECYPNCLGPDWESAAILKYEAGNLGPLQQAGPMLELRGKPHAEGVRGRGLFNVGVGGAF